MNSDLLVSSESSNVQLRMSDKCSFYAGAIFMVESALFAYCFTPFWLQLWAVYTVAMYYWFCTVACGCSQFGAHTRYVSWLMKQ